MMDRNMTSRRAFLGGAAMLTAGALLLPGTGFSKTMVTTNPEDLYLLGPKEGFSEHVGTLLSTMTMMRAWVVQQVKNLSMDELDFQIDDKSNSIGAMLLHLAATEKYYQLNTFDEMEWGSWDQSVKDEWDVPMNLGENGRKQIVGREVSYYLDKLEAVRKDTIARFKTLDDEWLWKAEPFFGLGNGVQGQTNNYAKWFHVCEHESNHNGQIKFIKSRIPS